MSRWTRIRYRRRRPPSACAGASRGARLRTLIVFLANTLALATPAAAQTGGVLGQVLDARSGQPVTDAFVRLPGTPHATSSDGEGRFALRAIAAGRYTLLVSHIAYGTRTVDLAILDGGTATLRVLLSDSAIVLEPIEVTAVSLAERRDRAAGYRRGIVTRAQLATAENSNMTMGDVLRTHVPGVRVRVAGNLVGAPVCIELRSVRTSFSNTCHTPAVYLDGVPIANPTTLFSHLDVNLIETMEVVPAAEAGARFGTGALYGALLIETRRPGAVAEDTAGGRRRSPAFDWSREPNTHPYTRSFLYAFLGNAAGLALGVTAANECIGTRQPANDRIIAKCDGGPTFAAATAALVLPALGGALGARLGGSTETSKGKLLPAVIGGAMALLPAYGLLFSAERMDSPALRGFGITLLVIGAPAVSTIADHQFRSRRGGVPPP